MRYLPGLLLAAVTLSAQDAAETHLAAAKAAAATDFVNLFNFQCYGPGPGGQRPVPGAPPPAPRVAGAPAAPRQAGPPARETWYREPAKVFDNLYWFGQSEYSVWAITTSEGIIVIDTIFDYSVEAEVVDGMKKLGLDPKTAWPVETFVDKGSMKVGGEQIDYGYLLMAHTSGDAYVHFKSANVIAVGDVASPVRDPELDWFTGGWVGGRVDSMDLVLSLSNDQTKFIPAYGPAMTKAEFKAERDMMDEVRQRIYDRVRGGEGPKDMLEGGALDGLPRKWNDPAKFLYAAAKGGWAFHDKLGPNVV